MQTFEPRAAHRPLARAIVILLGLGALAACGDATTAPTTNAPSRADANTTAPTLGSTASANLDVVGAATIPGYAGALIGLELTCSTSQTVDLIVGLEQEQKQGSTKTLAQGLGVVLGVQCTPATAYATAVITPYPNTLFQPGRATVRALVTSNGVNLAELTRRVRLDALQ